MDADAQLYALVGGHARISNGQPALDLNGRSYRLDNAPVLDHLSVADAFDEPADMDGDRRVDKVAAQRPKASERPLLIRPRRTAEAHDVGDQDRRDLPSLGNGSLSEH